MCKKLQQCLLTNQPVSLYHYDGDASSYISNHSDGRLLLGDQHWKQKQNVYYLQWWSKNQCEHRFIYCYSVSLGCVLALHGISMLGWMAPVVLTVGGECRPSTWSDSASWASPWITAIPRRSRSANDWALHTQTERKIEILLYLLFITAYSTSSDP